MPVHLPLIQVWSELFSHVCGAKLQAGGEIELWQHLVRGGLKASGGTEEGDGRGVGGQGELAGRSVTQQGDEGLARCGRLTRRVWVGHQQSCTMI